MAKTIAMVAKTVKHLYSFLLFFCVLNLCRLFWLAFLSRTFLNMVTYAQMMKVFIAAKIVSRQKMLNEVSKTNPMGFLPNLKENQPIGAAANNADDSQAPVIANNTVSFLITWYLRGRKIAMYFSAVIRKMWQAAAMATKLCETSMAQRKLAYWVWSTTGIKITMKRGMFKEPFIKSQIAKLNSR